MLREEERGGGNSWFFPAGVKHSKDEGLESLLRLSMLDVLVLDVLDAFAFPNLDSHIVSLTN